MSKIKVRIAVAIDHTGAWSCCGYGNGKKYKPHDKTYDSDMMENAAELLEAGENRYFLEAYLDVPETGITVQAQIIKSF